jgi:long-chain acyl-CoA synthetase
MMTPSRSIFLTGATGLIGRSVVTRLLAAEPDLRVFALVREPERWPALARRIGDLRRVVPVRGDLCADALGIAPEMRAAICAETTTFLHLAADTTFSNPLGRARAVNTAGTERVLGLAAQCATAARVIYISTAFVAGRRTGNVEESVSPGAHGWVNAYEQSKYEAEALVRERASRWMILRPSTVVCDDIDGGITQTNAVHRALRLYHAGLAAMMPGVADSTVDVVTTSYVAKAIAQLTLVDDGSGETVHLCAGDRALPLGELLDLTYERWAIDAAWRRRGIARPALADLETYALFERTIEEVGDPSLKRITRALSHFVPQLALPKRFATANAEALLGYAAPAVRDFWVPMLDNLLLTKRATDTVECAA